MTEMRTWEQNARAFAALDQGEGWPFARLVACSVENNGRGRPKKIDRAFSGKATATQFASEANTSKDRVIRYLEAWERAADAGIVPHAADLEPGDANNMSDPEDEWGTFYRAKVAQNMDEDRRERLSEAGRDAGMKSGSKVADVAANTKAMAVAIQNDPEVAEAAVKALSNTNHPTLRKPPVTRSGQAARERIEETNDAARLVTDLHEALRIVKKVADNDQRLDALPDFERDAAAHALREIIVACEGLRITVAQGVS